MNLLLLLWFLFEVAPLRELCEQHEQSGARQL